MDERIDIRVVMFQSKDNRKYIAILRPDADDDAVDAAIERLVRAKYPRVSWVNNRNGSIYDGERVYDADSYEPGEWLGEIIVAGAEYGEPLG